tara:strand:- start:53 stop:1792 length:1740 start_codon:yes stop_codon:yes gene_type:complete
VAKDWDAIIDTPGIYKINYLHETSTKLKGIIEPFRSINSFFSYLLEQLIDYDGEHTKDKILEKMFKKINDGVVGTDVIKDPNPDSENPQIPFIKFNERRGGIKVLDNKNFITIIGDIISHDFDQLYFISSDLMKIKCILASFLSFLKYASLNIYLKGIDNVLDTIDKVIEINRDTEFVALKLNIVFPNKVDYDFTEVFDQLNNSVTNKYKTKNLEEVNKIIYNPVNPKLGLKNFKDESTGGKLGAISADIPEYCTFGIPLPLGIEISDINSRIQNNKSWLGETVGDLDVRAFEKSINLTKLSHGGAFITLVFKYDDTYYFLGMVEKDGYGKSSIYKNGTAGGTIDYEEKNEPKIAATRELFEEIFMMGTDYFKYIYNTLTPITGNNFGNGDADKAAIIDFKDRFVVNGNFDNGTYKQPVKLNNHTLQSGFITETKMENFLCVIDLKSLNTSDIEVWLNNFIIKIQEAIKELGNPEGIHNVFILNLNTNSIIGGNSDNETLETLNSLLEQNKPIDYKKILLKPIRKALNCWLCKLEEEVTKEKAGGKKRTKRRKSKRRKSKRRKSKKRKSKKKNEKNLKI